MKTKKDDTVSCGESQPEHKMAHKIRKICDVHTNSEISKSGSNSNLVCYVQFCSNALGKGRIPFFILTPAKGRLKFLIKEKVQNVAINGQSYAQSLLGLAKM